MIEFELPSDVPRLLPVPGRTGDVIAIEELLRENVDLMHPNVQVDGAHLFRVTRRGDLTLDEEGAENLLDAVAEATERRPYNPAVRVEVERSMPAFVAELVLESLRRDAIAQGAEAAVDEVQVIDGMLESSIVTTVVAALMRRSPIAARWPSSRVDVMPPAHTPSRLASGLPVISHTGASASLIAPT